APWIKKTYAPEHVNPTDVFSSKGTCEVRTAAKLAGNPRSDDRAAVNNDRQVTVQVTASQFLDSCRQRFAELKLEHHFLVISPGTSSYRQVRPCFVPADHPLTIMAG